MADRIVPGMDDLVTCPYDKVHRIIYQKLTSHMMKCRKNHNFTFERCPYNAMHEVPQPEMAHHKRICSDRAATRKELQFYAQSQVDRPKGDTSMPPINPLSQVHDTDDWEREMTQPVVGYDVNQVVKNKTQDFYIKNPMDLTGLKPAQKREYRKMLLYNENRRANNMQPFENVYEPGAPGYGVVYGCENNPNLPTASGTSTQSSAASSSAFLPSKPRRPRIALRFDQSTVSNGAEGGGIISDLEKGTAGLSLGGGDVNGRNAVIELTKGRGRVTAAATAGAAGTSTYGSPSPGRF